MIQTQIMAGKLTMPNIHDMEGVYGVDIYRQIQAMFGAMWHTYLAKGAQSPISLPYWAKRIKHPRAMNQALKLLSDHEWITVSTRPNNNWSEAYLNESKLLTYVDRTQLDAVRMFHKFSKYQLELHNLDQDFGATKTKSNGRIFDSGLVRNGFAKTGKVPYQFDTVSMLNNRDLVVSEVNKGIEKMIVKYPQIAHDHANYRELGSEVVDAYIYSDGIYNGGPRTSDPRGRNNRGDLSKIGNPIGFKVMRSLLMIPVSHRNQATAVGLRNKYLFIAQLCGFKSGSAQAKEQFGRECYYDGVHAHDPVENLWLLNTYEDLNNMFAKRFESIRYQRHLQIQEYKAGANWHQARVPAMIEELKALELSLVTSSTHKWVFPIEIDMSASVIGCIGLLLGHKPYLDRCNITQGDLADAWGHDIITNRNQFKTAMRPMYGSQMSAKDMWNDMDIEYTAEEVLAFQHELTVGEFAPAMAMKDFIINNSRMQPEMRLVVNGESTLTYCNKFHNIGETTSMFDLYDTATNSIRRVHNTEIKQVPDLKSFKRFGPTALIHHLDGQVMDNTVDAVIDQFGWVIDIHDAMVLCAEAADYARDIYANGRTATEPSLMQIYTNRNQILSAYFTSLNIPASKVSEWKSTVVPLIQPMETELIINPLVLK